MTSQEDRRKQHRHRHKQRALRGIDDQLAADFDAAAKPAGGRSAITRAFWEWYVNRPGAQLPDRPEPDNHPQP
ncbi:hypothetical protein OHB04_02430 [Streptomyces sp. NBC_01775]|uniref:hypothetical protein n=1 Tax=Streptomyces sp. NBC_01775 TaxID=2975939 RepID=UPI002DDA77C3|nr:hypothetical protein [Streptomyces sp. NBC_01775]WSB74750.1 hypothetical protein OHB04_02430 [Streptomyces sp. NBC_01775]